VRGDEVVSLGWCFWHWGCFGCLVCGERMAVPDVGKEPNDDGEEEKEGERWGSWDSGLDTKRRGGVGAELSEIPLCRVCGVETVGESRGQVLERGLQTIDKFDGGLSRDRLEMLSDEGTTDLRVAKRRKLQSPRQRQVSALRSTRESGDRNVSLSFLAKRKC